MSISTRTLAAAGSAFILLALAFLFLRPGGLGKFNDTGTSTSNKAAWKGNGKSAQRETTKRPRRPRGMSIDDPEVQRKAEAWYQDLLARHPEFLVEFKDVPDAENGFLQFLDLTDYLKPGDAKNASLPIEDDLNSILNGTSPFDAAQLEAWIAKNPELFLRILSIAEAPGQSVKGFPLDRYHYIPGRVARSMGLLLQASTRAAMERGDPAEALRLHRASLNLANHFDGIEIPSLLTKTVSALLRSSAIGNFQDNILSGLVGNPTALEQWRATMPLPESINDTVPKLFTGEWHLSMRMYALPALISGEMGIFNEGTPKLEPAEQRAVIESYTSQMSRYIRQSPTTPAADLIDGSQAVIHYDPALSAAGNQFLEIFGFGSRAWLKGLGTQNSVSAQHAALLAIALGQEPPPEPITGKPFLWDPTTMTLTPPAALEPLGFALKPLNLPAAR